MALENALIFAMEFYSDKRPYTQFYNQIAYFVTNYKILDTESIIKITKTCIARILQWMHSPQE